MQFQIHTIAASPGAIGISALPGAADVGTIAKWGATLVLTMTTTAEMRAPLAGALSEHKITWEHLPIRDFGAPGVDVEALWSNDVSAKAHSVLDAGGRVLCHCRGGCGRSGMFALRLLIERGEEPLAALARIRTVRPCAVETEAQFDWASKLLT
ncbi:protein-tyrosine phosphatase family protein [Pontivivens insulae]|uniref:Tyrosine specific protein phosphatases domain-containing protein n=1 Tax=Pontivivens insulae TaxID=1639689 RepID=A0A2R8ACI2_9RHOB|nr:protein-tyrosine phosphatase family protein [Pontivivens insulae]RED13877.1 protein-tyrosine phosphatase [Pontivivens insulae]SPF29951.1 hypothetical protein POI8812_02278 [Pontivivens insulae]